MAAFIAWYNAFAGLADSSNRFVPICQVLSLPLTIMQLLRRPRSTLPLERQGPREAQEGGQLILPPNRP